MPNLGDNLKKFRSFKKLRQEDLANALGKSKNVISNWERGYNKPDADMIEEICHILEITPNDLLDFHSINEFETIDVAFNTEIKKLSKEVKGNLMDLIKSMNKQ